MVENYNRIAIEQIVPEIAPTTVTQLKRMIPSKAWFLNKHMYDGNHGVFHIIRTNQFADLASQREHLSDSQKKIILAAILIHDVDRLHEGRDKSHGLRRITYWQDNLDILRDNDIVLDEREQKMVIALRKYHETKHLTATMKAELKPEGMYLLNFVRLADALDRYRDPNAERHIDVTRLSDPYFISLATDLAPFAKAYVQRTETLRQSGLDPLQSFIQAGKEFGLVRET